MSSRKAKIMAALAAACCVGSYAAHPALAMTRQEAQNIIFANNVRRERENRAIEYYRRGLNAYKSQNYEGAIRSLRDRFTTNMYGGKRDYNIAMGDSYFHLRDYQNAISYLRKGASLGGSNFPVVNHGLGMSYYQFKDYSNAARFLSASIGSSLADGDSWWALADSYAVLGNEDKKIETLMGLIQKYPAYSPDAYFFVGDYYDAKGQYVKALDIFNRGNAYFKDNALLLFGAGHTCFLDGNFELAIEYLQKSNNIAPFNIDTLYDLGASYLNLDMLDEASACVDDMLKANKDHPKTQDLYKAVQQRIMQKMMEQQMQQDMINQSIQAAQESATIGVEQAVGISTTMPAGMMP